MQKVVVVTGGAGFIGVHLCKRLLDDGKNVVCVDNFSSSNPVNVEFLKKHPNAKNFEFIRHDIVDKLPIEASRVAQIYNLACPASPPHYQKDPVKTMNTAFNGLQNLLELAREAGATLLQASTSEVYGDPKVHPQPEAYWGNVNCIGMRACYDEGKRIGETLCFEYNRQYGVNVRVIRIFNTYGPYMHPFDGRVVSNFIRQALAGEPITIYGNGEQSRSFQFCTDLVEGMVRMMNNEQGFVGPVNLGNPHEFTVKQLCDRVLALTGSNSQIVHKPSPPDDPVVRQPVIDVAKRELNHWEPKVQLEEGLKATIEYFRTVDLSLFADELQSHLASTTK